MFKHLPSFYNVHLKCIMTSCNLGRFSLRKWEGKTKALVTTAEFSYLTDPLILIIYTKQGKLGRINFEGGENVGEVNLKKMFLLH